MNKCTDHQPWPPTRTVMMKVRDPGETAKIEAKFAEYNLSPVRVMRSISGGKTIKYLFRTDDDANLAHILVSQALAGGTEAEKKYEVIHTTAGQPRIHVAPTLTPVPAGAVPAKGSATAVSSKNPMTATKQNRSDGEPINRH